MQLVCLGGIGVVHAFGWDWPLRLPAVVWWVVVTAELAGYLLARHATLRRRLPSSAPWT